MDQQAYLTFTLGDFGRLDEDPEGYGRRRICIQVCVLSGIRVELSSGCTQVALVLGRVRLLYTQ